MRHAAIDFLRAISMFINALLSLLFTGWAVAILAGWIGPLSDKSLSIVLLLGADAALSCLIRLQGQRTGEPW